MNLFSFSNSLGWKEPHILPRLRALELSEPCARCGGRGHVGFERTPETICFKCRGHGDQLPKLTRKLCQEVARRCVAGKLEPYLAERKRRFEEASTLRLAVARCRAALPEHAQGERLELYGILRRLESDELEPAAGVVLLTALHARLASDRAPAACYSTEGR